MAEPIELPDRIQKDLEEALRHGGADKLPNRPPGRPRRRFRLGWPDPRPKNPGQLVLMAALAFLFSYLPLGPMKAYLILAALLMFTTAIVTYLAFPRPSGPRRWRDRYITLPPSSWQERLYRIVYRQN
jgi:hypothetical protein